MASTHDSRGTPKQHKRSHNRDESGIALFMVVSAIGILAIIVTELTYIASIAKAVAYDSLDQVKAHYVAKSGLKLALLRLKAFQQVNKTLSSLGGQAALPKSAIDKIWNFPFFYPLPTTIPGLGISERESLEKFQKSTALDGKFTSVIESESSKVNLNLILSAYAPKPSPTASPSPAAAGANDAGDPNNPNPAPVPSPTPSFNVEESRKSLTEYFFNSLQSKFEQDQDFASKYRDFRIDDFMDAVFAWADRTYQPRIPPSRDQFQPKRAPFYTVSELRLMPAMNDELFDLFSPGLTAGKTQGVNVNTINATTLRAIVSGMTIDEVKEFYKFRDSDEQDNTFKSADDFFKWLGASVAVFRGSQSQVDEFKGNLQKRGVRIIVDESDFKVTARAQVNGATRTIEAWVSFTSTAQTSTAGRAGTASTPAAENSAAGSNSSSSMPSRGPDPGLRITFMRVL